MTEKQGAAEWLREKAQSVRRVKGFGCKELMESEFGESCDGRRCADCYADLLERIAGRIDAERALPEGIEWPRFEDGELVGFGDEVEHEGETWKVTGIGFESPGFDIGLRCGFNIGAMSGSYGERLKRPTPKVLDADGAPIEVGETVYCDGDPEPLTVDSFDDPGCVYLTSAKGSDGTLYTIEPSLLTHKRPDSWERLEKDAYHLVMSEYLETPEKDVSDLVRRAKALAKAGEEA